MNVFNAEELDSIQELIEDRLTLISNYCGDPEPYPPLLKKTKSLISAIKVINTIAPSPTTLSDDMIKRIDIVNWLATNGSHWLVINGSRS